MYGGEKNYGKENERIIKGKREKNMIQKKGGNVWINGRRKAEYCTKEREGRTKREESMKKKRKREGGMAGRGTHHAPINWTRFCDTLIFCIRFPNGRDANQWPDRLWTTTSLPPPHTRYAPTGVTGLTKSQVNFGSWSEIAYGKEHKGKREGW